MHKRIKQTWTHKKPVRRNTFLQGTEILQIFKKKEKKKAKAIKTPNSTTNNWSNSNSHLGQTKIQMDFPLRYIREIQKDDLRSKLEAQELFAEMI